VWALREYPTSTSEQAILRHLGEKDGATLRIFTRQVTANEEKKIIHNAVDDPLHRTAEALIAVQNSRQRIEYIVESILTANQANLLEQLVRQAVRDELKSFQFCMPPRPEPEAALSALPDSLIHAMEDL